MDVPNPQPATPAVDVPSSTRRRIARALRARREDVITAWYDTQFHEERLRRFDVAGVDGLERDTALRNFLTPLADLLAGWIETGADVWRDVYLDERLRYAPHQAGAAVRRAFFDEVLPEDEAALEASLAGALDSDDPARLGQLLQDLHGALRRPPESEPVRMLALGDCLMNELRVFLPSRARRVGIELDMRCVYFSGLLGRGVSDEQLRAVLEEDPPHLVAASFLTYEGLPHYAALLKEADGLDAAERARRIEVLRDGIARFLHAVRERTDAPILLHNASGLPLSRWRSRIPLLSPLSSGRRRLLEDLNAVLADLVAELPNALAIDEAAAAHREGHRACAEEVIPARVAGAALFHTTRFGEVLATPYLDVVRAYASLGRAKVLLVDFDNTLWDGVMADGPVRHHLEAQRLLRRLREAGLLLVAVSKNDPENVRWGEMALEPDDFVLHKIGWDLKVQSIRAAAQELDLGLDAFVLIDDNPAERELVRKELPLVRGLDPTQPGTWRDLECVLAFPNTGQTEEARARTELYRQRAARIEALQEPVDYPALMRELGLRARFREASLRDMPRVAELVQRTNQFNTTTIRYSRPQLEAMLEDPDRRVFVGELADKFGDHGLVGVVLLDRKGEDAVLDSFIMSCRALGFEFERLMLALVCEAEADASRWVGRFVATDRNGPARTLYPDCGFRQEGETEWVLDPSAPRPDRPDWFELES